MAILPDTELLKITQSPSKEPTVGKFVLEPLLPGYGVTIGHALRRVLLSSLTGAAITEVRIEGATHEFSTLFGMKEDIVELILNLKGVRLKLESEEPATIKLEKKGPGEVKAKDFAKNALVEIINPDHHLASLDKKGKLAIEATIKKGHGYEPVENRQEKMPLGTIAIDAIFTPIKKIHYEVENTRVGRMTNYDKLTLEITTDGTIFPEEAFRTTNQILINHFDLIVKNMTQKKKVKTEKQLKLTETKAKKVPQKRVKKKEVKKKSIKSKITKKVAPKKKVKK